MSRPHIMEQKLGEKLLVLNNQVTGLLTRLHLTKSFLTNQSTRPEYLNKGNKLYDPVHKALVKNFPQVNPKHANSLQVVANIRTDILNDLSQIYYNFVDTLDLRNHIIELLGCLSGAKMQMDIILNFDLTRNYLDLVANYFALMYFFSQFEDRQLIVALFNQAYTSKNSIQEDSFPRLSQLILDFSNPLRQLHSDLNPYSTLLSTALESLSELYFKRLTRSTEWMQTQPFSLLAEAQKLSEPVMEKILPTDLLSGEDMERWIIFGYLMIHPELNSQSATQMWKAALSNSYVVTLFRNVVIEVHSVAIQYFETLKHYNRRVSELREYAAICYNYSPQFHRERRRYLRVAMKELTCIFSEQPGLLGPKIKLLLMTLSYARDELLWLMRHVSNLPQKKNVKISVDDFKDQGIAEYLNYIEDLRELCKKHGDVLKIYYLPTLSGYDAPSIANCISSLSGLSPNETEILNDTVNVLQQLSIHVKDNNLVDLSDPQELSAVRMDWYRLQTCFSAENCAISFSALRPLFLQMNSTTFNTKMVDYLEGVLESVSDLSFLFFYIPYLQEFFQKTRAIPAQHRYITSYARICSHFYHLCHDMCPEEIESIREKSFNLACQLCRDISREVCQALFLLAPQMATYAYELLPKESIFWLNTERLPDKKRSKNVGGNPANNKSAVGSGGQGGLSIKELPGIESIRRFREQMTNLDQLSIVLGELCTALYFTREITIFERIIYPIEIFLADLKERLRKFLGDIVIVTPENNTITRPTEVLNCLSSQFNVFINLENYLPIRITALFKECLGDHSLLRDSIAGRLTLTGHYVRWYTEVMLPFICQESVIYSTTQKTFVLKRPDIESLTNHTIVQYVDINELRALAELISADGISLLSECIVASLASLWEELRRLLLVNRQALDSIWESHNDGNIKRQQELAVGLQNSQDITERLRMMGALLIFRRSLREALNWVLEMRVPFLVSSARDVYDMSRNLVHLTGPESNLDNHLASSQLAGSMGFSTERLAVDAELMRAVSQEQDGDFRLGCLLPVCVASLLPRMARTEGCHFISDLGAHANNMHCIVPAFVALVNILLVSTGHVDKLENQWQTFLSLSTANLLPLEHEAVTGVAPVLTSSGKGEAPLRNRQAVYILLDIIVQACPYLSYNLLELCFPYSLIRSAYHDATLALKANR